MSLTVAPSLAGVPVLETERLRLRGPKLSDFETYAAFTSSPRAAFVGGAVPRVQAWRAFGHLTGHWALRGYSMFIIADKATDAPLGMSGPYFPEGWPEPEIVRRGHLYLAQPPLYRLTAGKESAYARDDAHRAELEATLFKGKKVEVGRFKGLGEMNPQQLRETTMDPAKRSLLRITLPPEYEGRAAVKDLVDRLMGRDPAQRFMFIQNRAAEIDPELIDA